MQRRQFLIRSTKAAASIFLASAAAYGLYDEKGPDNVAFLEKTRSKIVTLPDYSIAEMKGKMSIASGADRAKSVEMALKALGGIEKFIQTGDQVLLKVNAAFATPARLSATTHPELVSKVIHLCLQAGATRVVVTDNPINDPQSCFHLTGIAKATESAGGTLFLPKESFFQPTTVESGSFIQEWPLLYSPFENITKVIGIAPIKHHQRSGASMTIKNWYGLLGGRRNIFHQNIHDVIKELALLIKPTLVILDGTTTMMTNGPTGGSLEDLKNTNMLIVSTDPVAADAFGLTLLETPISQIPYISKAALAGAGTFDYKSLNPIFVDAN